MGKGSELEESKRRYKRRVVFGGHMIRDEYGLEAQFPEQGSGASFVTASKLLDVVAMLPGNCGEQSDARSAYTQSKLCTGHKGKFPDICVRLPKESWPKECVDAGDKDLVVPLRPSRCWPPLSGEFLGESQQSTLLKNRL